MGIVVTIFMLLGLLVISPWSKLSLGTLRANIKMINFIAGGLLLTGLWNSLWHGLRYLDHFWGLAALISGFFMVVTAVIIFVDYGKKTGFEKIYSCIKPLSLFWLIGLLVSFLLYAITLIQLNLGYPIIG